MDDLKVLILEDDIVIALHIENVLNKLNCMIVGKAQSYDEALDLASKNGLDLIIADIKILGEIDGVETAKVLHSLYKCEVLFLTANIDDQTLKNASSVQSIGYLVKPFRENELSAIIKMEQQKKQQKKESSLKLDENYTYIINEKKLYYKDEEVKFTKNESKLFNLLINNINNKITYEYIDEIIWYDKFVTDTNRRQLIFRLKHKLPNIEIEVYQNEGLSLKI
jgi:DNA-binding response OmpR family regulator